MILELLTDGYIQRLDLCSTLILRFQRFIRFFKFYKKKVEYKRHSCICCVTWLRLEIAGLVFETELFISGIKDTPCIARVTKAIFSGGGGGWHGNGNGNGGYSDFREPNPYQPVYHTPDNRHGRRHQRFQGMVS